MQIQHHSTSQTCLFIYNVKWLKIKPKLQHLTFCTVLLFTTPLRISPDNKCPAYSLFLLFHHQRTLLRVFQTQTITDTPKSRSWAKLLHSTSETLTTRAKTDQTGNFRTCTSLPVDFIWATEPFFFFSLHFGGGGEKEETKIFPVFRSQMELQNKKLKKPFPALAESTGPAYLMLLCSSYLMKELRFEILRSAGCLEHYLQQSWKTHLHLCAGTTASEMSTRGRHRLLSAPPECDDPTQTPFNSGASKGWARLQEHVRNISTTKRWGWTNTNAAFQI